MHGWSESHLIVLSFYIVSVPVFPKLAFVALTIKVFDNAVVGLALAPLRWSSFTRLFAGMCILRSITFWGTT